MIQHQFEGNKLILKVKKVHAILRGFLFMLSLMSFAFPISMIAMAAIHGMHGRIISLMISLLVGLVGTFLLRMALWNSFGTEELLFEENKVSYLANYKWFKDGRNEIALNDDLEFQIQDLNEEGEGKGALVLKNGEESINCVTSMATAELEQLIQTLNDRLKKAK